MARRDHCKRPVTADDEALISTIPQ
ncbi:hypothetical protein I315_02463 [Cryptococcus gattii Ru294]|uniref:Uncharacterized protein n=1 Tax=Cryptococcus gattii EJB2 TaxID=1296103 RepID=A0ABR5BUB0_9TREE|nr:hypothetical protein I315_02463 [Cryptococcus gattii Ru294]KIR79232.1 hypothetical protein I306_03651 [Cryptococcus gattii EJB2]KIY35165.1 hypothetical protein I305_02071 [Cryptococcus gattii E566]KJE05629.1 hypothetical protein I311_00354 [Cryptococcus gattii NT-10]